ncbi:Autophagy-related protein 9 [Neolecta irregularis DAH-3]|uniref:Autophagy-related protein 9 n=1 Tax=Neolecta irregularis (strain DAH-3) TaxID=1198029 RepID=A0A1U7LHQ7_NEOID|nr:Autophagy-related protein 9 [Neolecta irregularis DAH-3]|eukprot:OLL22179.1 Autophagy-related protein 9 [Neolecta irregularis DAH-3]
MQSMWSNMWGGGSVYERRDAHSELYPLSGRSSSSEEGTSHQRLGLFGGYHQRKRNRHRNTGAASLLHRSESDHDHNDVPDSLLYEHEHEDDELPLPATARRILHVEHGDETLRMDDRLQNTRQKNTSDLWSLHAKEQALWRWHNIANMDLFISDLYTYYVRKGLTCIILDELIYFLIMVFIICFSIYLTRCIDYSKIPHSSKLAEVKIPHCMAMIPFGLTFIIWVVVAFTIFHAMQKVTHLGRWREMQQIYLHILEIDIQTISWQEIVRRLMEAREKYPTSPLTFENLACNQRINPHDVANRIMRRDNYFIALITRGTLKLRLPLPFIKEKLFFTRHLEWYLNMVVMDYFCDRDGHISPFFLKESEREKLSQGLRKRIQFFAIIAFICGPISFAYLIIYNFFRYFHEYQKNPGVIGSRRYTRWAQWKFRQFNELDHYFQERLGMSYPIASEYINQLPKEKTNRIAQFVAFVSGSFAAVLAVATLLDPELFLGFEITQNRTVLFYLGILGTIYGVARSMISDDMIFFDPEQQMREVAECTHYMPEHWEGRLHTIEVQQEFSSLYQYEIFNLVQEIFSALLVPFILMTVDSNNGMGLVCSHAVFDFTKPSKDSPSPIEPQDENARIEAKMQSSMMIFRENNSAWVPEDMGRSILDESGGAMHTSMHQGNRQLLQNHKARLYRTARSLRNKRERYPVRQFSESNDAQEPSYSKQRGYGDAGFAAYLSPPGRYTNLGRIAINPPDTLQEVPEEEQRMSLLTDSFQSTGQPAVEEHRNMDDITAGGDPIHILGKFYQETGRAAGGSNR